MLVLPLPLPLRLLFFTMCPRSPNPPAGTPPIAQGEKACPLDPNTIDPIDPGETRALVAGSAAPSLRCARRGSCSPSAATKQRPPSPLADPIYPGFNSVANNVNFGKRRLLAARSGPRGMAAPAP